MTGVKRLGDRAPAADAPAASPAPKAAGISSSVRFLVLLALLHLLVDTVACVVTPLWPELESNLALNNGAIFWLVVLWTSTTSFSQLLFGYLGDSVQRRWLLWAGPAAAIVCLSCVGLVNSPWALGGILVIAGLGIAAFHPEAAAAAGACAPRHRSRAMAVFALGGYFGQSVGPYYSGAVTQHIGMPGLAWTAVWGLAVLVVLMVPMRSGPPTSISRAARPAAGTISQASIGRVCLLLAVGIMRVVAPAGAPLAVAYLLAGRGSGSDDIGLVQSVFMAGIGSGGLACAALIGRSRERLALWLSPVCAAPLLTAIPWASGAWLLICVGASGLVLGSSMPVLISYGQQLLARGQRVASSLTMGVSWGVGGALAAGAVALLQPRGRFDLIFIVLAGASVVSALLSLCLPKVEGED